MADPVAPPGTPRWVKVTAVTAFVLVLLVAVMLLVGGGNHGPGRHTGSDSGGNGSAPAGAPEGHRPPEGAHP